MSLLKARVSRVAGDELLRGPVYPHRPLCKITSQVANYTSIYRW